MSIEQKRYFDSGREVGRREALAVIEQRIQDWKNQHTGCNPAVRVLEQVRDSIRELD